MERIKDRVAIHLARGRRRIMDPGEIYFVHRDYLVNIRRVREVRRRRTGRDWELKLSSPANRILPISRRALGKIWSALGE